MRCISHGPEGVPADVAAALPSFNSVMHRSRHLLATCSPTRQVRGACFPGRGGLPLEALLAAMPPDALLACEAPLGAAQAALSPQERALAVFTATMDVLGRPPAVDAR